jgi:tetratricopeptide (TPR) repeat protein
MNRPIHRLVLAAVVALPPFVASAQSPAVSELHAALRAARDADLKADWDGLVDARARVAAADRATHAPGVVFYHLGYVDWRLSSLAYLVTGQAGMIALLDRAVEQLRSSVAASPTFAEAQALLATCAGILGNADRSRLQELGPVMKGAWTAALEHGAENPRVQLLRAMTEFFVPPQYGGNRERGLERWKEAIRLFEEEAKRSSSGAAPVWGHAEAWAWLGGAYLTIDRHSEARAALEEAVRLRPDFWWAAQAALPQARRPTTK